ncbi:MAG TPA: hypothetical protein VKV26_06190 [Dehalococcoidia bacterium]|nr:hypothetical protein [Dehalococcoidia bacterium]
MLIALIAILAFLLAVFAITKVVAFLIGLVFLLLVATLCGAIAEHMLHYDSDGILTTVGVGLVGSVIGWLIARVLHLPTWPHIASLPIVWTVVGSLVLVAGMKVVSPPSRRRQLGSGKGLLR